jgi:Shikimate 5'-dehydrogenase C-terminal domain
MREITGPASRSSPSRDSPLPEQLLHHGLCVADAVYFPLWTPLLIAAKATGARVMTGRDLAIYQAAEAFELFTGLAPSTAEMRKAFDRVMSEARAGQRGDPHLMELSIKGEFRHSSRDRAGGGRSQLALCPRS